MRHKQTALLSFTRTGLAVVIAAVALSTPASADRRGYDSSGPNPWAHACTADERGRIGMASRAWCIANDGELECDGARWQCCDDVGHCSDGGTLGPAQILRVAPGYRLGIRGDRSHDRFSLPDRFGREQTAPGDNRAGRFNRETTIEETRRAADPRQERRQRRRP